MWVNMTAFLTQFMRFDFDFYFDFFYVNLFRVQSAYFFVCQDILVAISVLSPICLLLLQRYFGLVVAFLGWLAAFNAGVLC